MLSINETEVAEITAVLKALAEPNRMRIFATLMNGDSCNCELQEALSLAPNLLSHHLRTLEKAGLVHSRRDQIDGRWIYYSIDRAAATRWQAWFNHFLDPSRLQERTLCGPEGQFIAREQITVSATS